MNALILASMIAMSNGGGGQLPPPPQLRWECNCTAWAVVWEWPDGSRQASTGDTTPEGMAAMMSALAHPWQPVASLAECFRECHQLCNEGMPAGAPNAVCSATWIGATQSCQCICRNLDGDCPPTPGLPVAISSWAFEIGVWSQEMAEYWTLEQAWAKRHIGR